MMKKTLALMGAALLMACSHTPEAVSNVSQGEKKPVDTASIEAKQVAAEHEAPYVTEVQFQKGSQKLTQASREKLNQLFERARKNGADIDKVITVAWADQEYPSDQKKSLAQGQKDLAKNRNKEMKNFFQAKDKGLDVEEVSMAERPNALNEFLKGEDTRIKESLEAAGIPETGSTAKGQSKASKAMAMIVLKETKK